MHEMLPLRHGLGERPPLVGRTVFDAALNRYGLASLPRHAGVVRLRAGEELVLEGGPAAPALAFRSLYTSDVDELKSWIGVPDELAVLAGELPAAEWSGAVTDRTDLDAAQWRDLRRAAHQYLFGSSHDVASYRALIEHCFGPFEADLWIARGMVIEPGAALVVRRRPAALLVDDLELHAGGEIRLHSTASLTIGTLRKIERPSQRPAFQMQVV